MNLEAILFDLHGTLGYVEEPISSEEISEYLLKRDYKVYVCMHAKQSLADLRRSILGQYGKVIG